MCFSPWKDFDNLAANDPALTQTPQENVPASNNLKHLKALLFVDELMRRFDFH